MIEALKAESLLNESVGAGYIERNWPPALKVSGAWPMSGLRQSFLNGALTRLLDPDAVLKGKICEFVGKGDFGLGSNQRPDGTYDRVWYDEFVDPADVTFDKDVFLLTKATANKLRSSGPAPTPEPPSPEPPELPGSGPTPEPPSTPGASQVTVRVQGAIPPEIWNRLGTKLLPKIKQGKEISVEVNFSCVTDADLAKTLVKDLGQVVDELGIAGTLKVSTEG